jgi:CO/xanthine dehydrogenase Mo-binding subunit
VKLLVGSTEIGQGARTVFTQIVAEVLGVPMARIEVPGADTSMTPFDRSTGASRSTTLVGLAVERAARDVLAQLAAMAAGLMEADADDVTYSGGAFSWGAARVSLDEVVAALGTSGDELVGRGRVGLGHDSTEFPIYWEVCAGGAAVEVHEDTGKVVVTYTVGAPDVGRAINPQLVAVQDSGCTIQALGHTLLEELEFGADGELLTPSLVQYRVPNTEDIPHRMECEPVENVDGPGPFGAKGCGEGAFGAVPAAIMTALRSAGVQLSDLPATPARVWASLHPEAPGGEKELMTYRALG